MNYVVDRKQVSEMLKGLHPLQVPYKEMNQTCSADRRRFDLDFRLFLESQAEDGFKFFGLDEDPIERLSWAVDFHLKSFPYEVIANIHEFIASDFALSRVAYNLRIDIHPIYFSLFSDMDTVYCGFSHDFLLQEEAECLIMHGLGEGAAINLGPKLNLARTLLSPGSLFKLLGV